MQEHAGPLVWVHQWACYANTGTTGTKFSKGNGLCSDTATDRQNMRRASDAKSFLQTWNANIITQQNAREKQSLRFGENLRDEAT